MADVTATVGSWFRRIGDTVRWIAQSEELPPARAAGPERREAGPSDLVGDGVSTAAADDMRSRHRGAVAWLFAAEVLPEDHGGVGDGAGDRGRRSSRRWVGSLLETEALPSVAGDRSGSGGLLAWLVEREELPESGQAGQGEERARGH